MKKKAARSSCAFSYWSALTSLAICAIGGVLMLLVFAIYPKRDVAGQEPSQDDSRGEMTAIELVVPTQFRGDVRDLPQFITPQERMLIHRPLEPEIDLPKKKMLLPGILPAIPTEAPPGPLAPMPTPAKSFNGMDYNSNGGVHPPDTVGDVGPNHFVQAVNISVGIYNKTTGAAMATFTFNSLWAGAGSGTPCDTSHNGDPTVIYDPQHDRFIVADFSWNNLQDGPYYECIAVSMTSDPVSGGWWRYPVRADNAAHPWLPDYPKMGIWPDGLYMSANMFDCLDADCSDITYKEVRAYALNIVDLVNGAPLRGVVFDNNTANRATLLPSNYRGSPPPVGASNYFVGESRSAFAWEVFKFHADYDTVANSTFIGPTNVAQASYTTAASTVPQPPPGNMTDTLADRAMMQNQYRNIGGVQSLWVNHTTGTAGASTPTGVQWAQINVTGGTISTTPVQQQIYNNGADGLNRFMGSLAVDRGGNMALGYTASSLSVAPDIRYVGRLSTDPLNTLPQTEVTMLPGVARSVQTGNCGPSTCDRWGDYSAMTVDPSDDCTFWYTHMYFPVQGGNWVTRIGSFRFPTCGASPSPTATPAATPTATVGGTPTPTPMPTTTPCGGTLFSQNFDSVTAPALPPGWAATNPISGDGVLWVTSTANPSTFPNSAFIPDQTTISDKVLDTPGIAISSSSAQLSFRNSFDTEFSDGTYWDGGVLEVSSPNINGGAFTDITDPAVGASFLSGGYTGVIDSTANNPLAGRMAWSSNSFGYINTVVNLGPNLNGRTIKLRFRMATDEAVGALGWHIDNVLITGGGGCPSPSPGVTPVPTATPVPSPSATCPPGWSAGGNLPSLATRAVGNFFPSNGRFYAMGGRNADVAGADFNNPLEYNPGTNTWITKASFYPDNKINNMACGVLSVSGTPQIFCVGGNASQVVGNASRVFSYNPVTDTFIPLTTADDWPGSVGGAFLPGGFAVLGNKLYIIGGFSPNSAPPVVSAQTWQFDPNAATGSRWLQRADLPVARCYVPAATIGGFIYTGGGSDVDAGGLLIDTAESFRYDPVANFWTAITNIPRATAETRAVVVNNKMWILGGGRVTPNPSNQVNIYDPGSNTWSVGLSFNTARRNFPADSDGTSRVFVAGGYDASGTTLLNTTEVFGSAGCGTPATLGNISTRLRVETGNNVLIGGFIITGTQPKRIIVRAIGPSLPFPGTLANPTLELRDSSGGLIFSDDNWRTGGQEAEIIATGIPPSNDLESAIVATLPANSSAYTATVRGVNNGTGIGVVEAYDLNQTVNSKLANISTRGLVQTGDNVMIGGLIVLGQSPLRVIVRAIGPSLPVVGALEDPTLELRDGFGTLLASNDDWRDGGQEAEIIATGIPPSADLESAIVRNLNPGNYTAIVRGFDNGTGVALVEAYGLN